MPYWRSCSALFIALRPGWNTPWAWTWTWSRRQRILHPTESLASASGADGSLWSSALFHGLPAGQPQSCSAGMPVWNTTGMWEQQLFPFCFSHTNEHPLPAFSAGTGWSSAVPRAPHPINSLLLKLPEQVLLSAENSHSCIHDATYYHSFGSLSCSDSSHLHQTLPLAEHLCKPPFCETSGHRHHCSKTSSTTCCQAGREHMHLSLLHKLLWQIQ